MFYCSLAIWAKADKVAKASLSGLLRKMEPGAVKACVLSDCGDLRERAGDLAPQGRSEMNRRNHDFLSHVKQF